MTSTHGRYFLKIVRPCPDPALHRPTTPIHFCIRTGDDPLSSIESGLVLCCILGLSVSFRSSSSSCPHVPLLWLCSLDGCVRRMAIPIVFHPDCYCLMVSVSRYIESIVLSSLLFLLADFICGSRIVYYISNLIVECNKQEAFIFVNPCCHVSIRKVESATIQVPDGSIALIERSQFAHYPKIYRTRNITTSWPQ